MKFLKITAIVAVSILGLLAFIGWLSPESARSEAATAEVKPEEKEVTEKPVAMVSSSQVVDWNGLPDSVRKQVSEFQMYYDGGWAIRNGTKFNRDSAYYVRLTLDNQQLAKFSESEAFPPAHTLTENPRTLYGKYKNKWAFDGPQGGAILPTEKFTGFYTIDVKRTGNSDQVWVGPIEEKPKTLKIVAYEHPDQVYTVDLQNSTK